MNKQFKNGTTHLPIEDLRAYIEEYVRMKNRQGLKTKLMLGCDSQARGSKIHYYTVICLYTYTVIDTNKFTKEETIQGKGAHILYTSDSEKAFSEDGQPKDLFTKLWGEVERTREVAEFLDIIAKELDVVISIDIHIDLNTKSEEKSHQVWKAGAGLFQGMGFEVQGKPGAFAASYAADHFCKGKHDGTKGRGKTKRRNKKEIC